MSTQNLLLIVGLFVATLLGTAGGYVIAVKYQEGEAARRAADVPANEVFKQLSSQIGR